MDITTKFRSHWVAADGTHHASRLVRSATGEITRRYDLQPILNIDELRAYAALGDQILPPGPFSSQDAARRVAFGEAHDPYIVSAICAELTDDVPCYHAAWRQPFIDLRNRWPGVDGRPVVALS
jgi:hypothetical protein